MSARFADVADRLRGARGLSRAVLVQVQLPGRELRIRELRIEREEATNRHVYLVNGQEVTVNDYLAVTHGLMRLK